MLRPHKINYMFLVPCLVNFFFSVVVQFLDKDCQNVINFIQIHNMYAL